MTTTSRPHVLHVVANLNLGGSEEVALALTEQLAPQCRFGVFAVLGVADTAVGRDMHARLAHLDVPVFCGTALDMKRGGMLQAGARLRQVLNRVRPDVVHLHTDIPDGTYAASTLFGRDRPDLQVMRTIHNTVLWPKWRRVGRWVERRLEHARNVAVSPASLEGLHRFRAGQGLGRLPDDRCSVVLNGVALHPGRPAQRAPGPARLLFAGRLEPQKGVDLLPEILERAADLTPADAHVTLLGQGSLEEPLRRWADSGRLRWPLSFSPPVPRLAAHLADYDAVLMPSRFEGLALLGIEALMAGTPVVASRIDGLRELFPPGSDLLVEPGDTGAFARRVAALVADPQADARQAHALVASTGARFGLPQMAGAYLGLYRQYAGAGRSQPARPPLRPGEVGA
ncbi:glycosyltransferase [Deinococcus petrolearius]|uniref:Glycosyltransferase n=1 Tax=Deinococcus petrolearius TaxID=1751295 RepID=A0ABW1DN34_9DEIO